MAWQVSFRMRVAPHDPYAGVEAPTLTLTVLGNFEEIPERAREKLSALVRIPDVWTPTHVAWLGGAYEGEGCPF